MTTNYCIENCPICGGAGFVDLDNGSVAICKNSNATFGGTGVGYQDLLVPDMLPKTKIMANISRELTALAKQGFGLIYIAGDFGIGKTVSAKAMTAKLAQDGIKGVYCRQSEMISHIREGFDAQSGQVAVGQRLSKFKSARWLVIDEVGRDRMTDFARETLAEIIDARYQGALNGKTMTVLISNDLPEDILQPYLVDRIRDRKNKVLIYRGKSLRGSE